jgi:5-oxoprolinase (ATP-hydrolysing)
VLSAYGMGLADQVAMREASVEHPPQAAGLAEAEAQLALLAEAAAQEVAEQGVARASVQRRRKVHVRYQGTDTALVVPLGNAAAITAAFEAAYRQRVAFVMPGRALVIESVEAAGEGERHAGASTASEATPHTPAAYAHVRLFSGGLWREAGLFVREQLQLGAAITGPAIGCGWGQRRRCAAATARPSPRASSQALAGSGTAETCRLKR